VVNSHLQDAGVSPQLPAAVSACHQWHAVHRDGEAPAPACLRRWQWRGSAPRCLAAAPPPSSSSSCPAGQTIHMPAPAAGPSWSSPRSCWWRLTRRWRSSSLLPAARQQAALPARLSRARAQQPSASPGAGVQDGGCPWQRALMHAGGAAGHLAAVCWWLRTLVYTDRDCLQQQQQQVPSCQLVNHSCGCSWWHAAAMMCLRSEFSVYACIMMITMDSMDQLIAALAVQCLLASVLYML
jgi:hypothetical protein